jgi:GDSL-like Lipase/Acylhydrolase family
VALTVAAILALTSAGIASWRGVRTERSALAGTQPHPDPTPAPGSGGAPSPSTVGIPTPSPPRTAAASAPPSDPTPTPGHRRLPLNPSVWPVVPSIDAAEQSRLRDVYLHGQALGNHSNVFVKAGDSITATDLFLTEVGCGAVSLAGHTDVLHAIDVFSQERFPPSYTTAWCGIANSFTRDTVAAFQGWTAAEALKPFSGSPPDRSCADPPFDAPLPCEIHLLQPSVALIMFGTNDTEHSGDPASFAQNLHAIVQTSVAAGVIPILSTIPPRPNDSAMDERVHRYNEAILGVAAAEQVPLVNYWRALVQDHLVNEGISGDGIHPNVYGGCAPHCESTDFSAAGLRYGFNMRNLVSLEALEKVLTVVIEDGQPDAGPLGAQNPAGSS